MPLRTMTLELRTMTLDMPTPHSAGMGIRPNATMSRNEYQGAYH